MAGKEVIFCKKCGEEIITVMDYDPATFCEQCVHDVADLCVYDNEKITDEWLAKIGFSRFSVNSHVEFYLSATSEDHHLRYTKISRQFDGWRVNGLGCRTPENRGELLKLCSLVGIKVAES